MHNQLNSLMYCSCITFLLKSNNDIPGKKMFNPSGAVQVFQSSFEENLENIIMSVTPKIK